jgi:hypothetical protein
LQPRTRFSREHKERCGEAHHRERQILDDQAPEFLDMTRAMRRDEAQFWREFEEARPRILGALLDAAAAGLRNLPNIKLAQPPRMADFAIWVNACEENLEMKPGDALDAYQSNRAETHNLARGSM